MIRSGISTLVVAAMLAVAGTAASAAPVAYTLDPGHTQVAFNWNHLGLSNPGAVFEDVSGTLDWDEADPTNSSVRVRMNAASINTLVPALDEHFMSAEFFDVERFPVVTFESTKVERNGIGNTYRVHGNLTVRDVTKPVVLDATLNGAGVHPMYGAPAIGFDATATLKRSDFGLAAFLPAVSDEIQVRITTEAVEAAAFKKAIEEAEKAAAAS